MDVSPTLSDSDALLPPAYTHALCCATTASGSPLGAHAAACMTCPNSADDDSSDQRSHRRTWVQGLQGHYRHVLNVREHSCTADELDRLERLVNGGVTN